MPSERGPPIDAGEPGLHLPVSSYPDLLSTYADCGKNGDQLLRLFDSPAELFVVQFVGIVSEAIIKNVAMKVEAHRASGKSALILRGIPEGHGFRVITLIWEISVDNSCPKNEQGRPQRFAGPRQGNGRSPVEDSIHEQQQRKAL